MEQLPKILELLNSQQKNLTAKDRDEFYEATTALLSICQRFYDDKSAFQKDLEHVRNQLGMMRMMQSRFPAMGPDLPELKKFYSGLLNSIISEIENLGFPSKKDFKIDKSVNVNVSQHQTIEMNFVKETLKNELTGKQFEELQAIVKKEKDPENAKTKLAKKLQDFGVNVTSNIISSLLTNPTLWAAFGR